MTEAAPLKRGMPSPLRFLCLLLSGAVALIAGLVLIGILVPQPAGRADKLMGISPGTLVARGYLVMALEAIAYTMAPIEIARRLWKRPLLGAVAGAAIYVIGIHWDNGWRGLAAATWIVVIVSGGYLLERTRSLPWATALAISLKFAFWTFALVALAV